MNYISQGGPVMWLLLLASVTALTLVMERAFHLSRAARGNRRLLTGLGGLPAGAGPEAIEAVCSKAVGPLAAVIRSGLMNLPGGDRASGKAVTEAVDRELFRLEKHLDTLAFIAGAAPLLGLLGTVTGMIRTFDVFSRQGASDPLALAGGISEALITTATGLIIALPVMAAHHYFCNRVDAMAVEAEETASQILKTSGG